MRKALSSLTKKEEATLLKVSNFYRTYMHSILGSQEKPLGDDSYVSSNEGDAPINLEQGKLKIELKSKEEH